VIRDLLNFDPGEVSAWSWFHDGELSRAWFGPFEAMMDAPPRPTAGLLNVLVEMPFGRPREKDVNALLSIARKVGRIEEFYRHRGQVETVWPTTWKGSVPKRIHNNRVLRCLTPAELARVPLRPRAKDYDHNCVDSIGMGLWKLGRMR